MTTQLPSNPFTPSTQSARTAAEAVVRSLQCVWWDDRDMEPSDEVWNRATMAAGGLDPGDGDIAIASVLALHSLAMNGGLLDAVERLSPEQLAAADAGFRWLRLEAAAGVVAMVRQEIEAGALDDERRADELETRADDDYALVIPTDQTIVDAFEVRFAEVPTAFAPI